MHNLRPIFAAVALVLVVTPLVASAPLFDPDEGLHAAIAQEMLRRGDYVTPTFLGEPFLDKPILFFWAEAASLRVFGEHETAVRLPPLLFGLAGMLAVALLGRALFGEAAGLVSGIVYGTMLLPFGVSQVAVHDVGLVPFMCVAAWCLVAVASPDPLSARKRLGLAVLAGACLGLSILTKGLVGVVFVGIFGACLAAARLPALIRLATALTIAVVVAALVAAPWYFAMEQAHPGYLHYYFVERHLQGYLTATQRHAGRPFWYYLPIVLGGALPWTLYLPGAARTARANPVRLVLWGWFVIGLVFLSLGESKLVTYALPVFPALALILGELVHEASVRGRRGRLFTGALALHVLLLAVLPAATLIALQSRDRGVPSLVWLLAAVFGLLTLDAGRRAWRAAGDVDRISWLAQASICSAIAMTAALPYAAAWMTGKDLAANLNAGGVLPPRVSVLDERIGSLVFYLDPALRAEASRERLDESTFPEAIARVRHDPEDAVVAVRNSQLEQFNRLFPAPPAPDARAGTFTVFRIGTLRTSLQETRPPR
jgi:4-amino-4-deoxy-L-arabinose transferase-like glycosyltransferase